MQCWVSTVLDACCAVLGLGEARANMRNRRKLLVSSVSLSLGLPIKSVSDEY